jgi:hypothetical protein
MRGVGPVRITFNQSVAHSVSKDNFSDMLLNLSMEGRKGKQKSRRRQNNYSTTVLKQKANPAMSNKG